jgi:hypothetical protein
MVIPFCAPDVAHLVHQGLQAVVHVLWLFPLAKPEATEFPSIVSRLVILVTSSPSCAVLSTSQISLALFNPCTLLYSSRLREARSIVVAWELKCRIWVTSSDVTCCVKGIPSPCWRTPRMEPSHGLWQASRRSRTPSWRMLPTSLRVVRL